MLPKRTLNGSDFLRINGSKTRIMKEPNFVGYNWKDSHFALAENGYYMPTVKQFFDYFLNVKHAAFGWTTLYDHNGKEISQSEAEKLHMRYAYSRRAPLFVWLDSYFFEKDSRLYVSEDHRVNSSGELVTGKTRELENCLRHSSFISYDSINGSGVPRSDSMRQKPLHGENLYYNPPKHEGVARFEILSKGNVLDLGLSGDDCFEDSGVFACFDEK